MSLDLCIPAYNEEPIIADTLRKISTVLRAAGLPSIRLIVVDNDSSDDTAGAARRAGVEEVEVLMHPQRGKGHAIRAAARLSESKHFGFIDADLSADPTSIAPLLALVESGEADIAIGSRLLDPRTTKRGVFRSASSRAFNLMRRLLLGIAVADSQCGLKVMNEHGRAILVGCVEKGWFLDLEFLARAEKAGLVIREVPIMWEEERYKGRVTKLRVLRDGLSALAAMVRIRKALS